MSRLPAFCTLLLVLLLGSLASAQQLPPDTWIDVTQSPAVDPLPGEINIAPPSAQSPAASPATGPRPPTRPRQPMRFSLAQDSDGQQISLFVQRGVTKLGPGRTLGEGFYEPLCHGACEFTLRPGTHMFAVTKDGGRTIKLDRALRIERGQELVVKYRSRRAQRAVGWCLLAALVGSGIALYSLSVPRDSQDEGQLRTGYVVGGSVLVVSGLLSGLWLANLPDKATGWVKP